VERLKSLIARKEDEITAMRPGTRKFYTASDALYRLKQELRHLNGVGVAGLDDEPIDTTEDDTPPPSENRDLLKKLGVQSSKDILNTKFDTLPFNGAWGEFMQTPGANLKAVVYGKPKNGKTSFSFQFADYLSAFGPVLYVLADQGIGEATKQLIRNMQVGGNEDILFKAFRDMKSLDEMAASGAFKFIFIDLINNFQIAAQDMETFFHKYPHIGIILVMESTKDGNFRGEQKWTHIVDAIITVENWVASQTGRYGSGVYKWPKPILK